MPNIIFAGTPDFAAFHLQALIDNNLTPSLVITQPDRQSGRGRKINISPVKSVAIDNHIEVFQPETLDTEAKIYLDTIADKNKPDLMIIVAYGLLLPQWTLDLATHGAINVHASLLPRWRGAAPIQRAIEQGDEKSGVGIMQMQLGLDTGDIWSEVEIPITENTTAQSLHDDMQTAGAKALIDIIPIILNHNTTPTPQSDVGITYAKKLSKEEAKINWSDSAPIITRKIRAFNPVPVAHTKIGEKRFRIYQALPINNDSTDEVKNGTVIQESKDGILVKCHQGAILITELQEIGKKRLFASDYLNGKSLLGEVFE